MKFNIVENAPPNYFEKYSEFIELYNNPEYSVEDIKRILKWNAKQMCHARERGLKEGVIKPRYKTSKTRVIKSPNKPSYYSKTIDGKYVIRKYIDGEYIYCGRYTSEEDVKKIVSELKKVNWDKSYLPSIKEKLCRN